MILLLRTQRRSVYEHTCLLSAMAAFIIGLVLGIFFLPLIASDKSSYDMTSQQLKHKINSSIQLQQSSIVDVKHSKRHKYDFKSPASRNSKYENQKHEYKRTGNIFTPATINNNLFDPAIYSSVLFISDGKYSKDNILRNLHNEKTRKVNISYGTEVDVGNEILYDNDDPEQRMEEGINSNKIENSQPNRNINNNFDNLEHGIIVDGELQGKKNSIINKDENFKEKNSSESENAKTLRRIVEDDVYWGQIVENSLPLGFSKHDSDHWIQYLETNTTEIVKMEQGCGRMQNRLVTFTDGLQACVRYRQNTDQIQGELFSFFLGRLLNLTNLAPSTAAIIDWDSKLWSQVKEHITESQWKTSRPVVLTKYIANLEPSGIPDPFRPLERHLNKDDVQNITLDDSTMRPSQILIDRLKPKHITDSSSRKQWQKKKIVLTDQILSKFVELAQWSDLIIFDYLIANLDRVVNNLYNFQWNADIMSAPAHNLAKQSQTNLLMFLDNESGLLHGYRLLRKYEGYHELLLDNLCLFRRSTVDALKVLRVKNPGEQLSEFFERTTSAKVREVLPPLPEKSVKILTDRIDRVLHQVQKCQINFSNT